ncbi:MAG TPA: glycosyltransferase [Gaiellaceae bacterium]|nr:glycosyltransferase [Gaiellaceae bacterium]
MNVLAGLAEAGSVDLFCSVAERPDLDEGPAEPTAGVSRVYVHRRGAFGLSPTGLRRWLLSGLPRAYAWIDWNDADGALARFATERYDVVWFSHCHPWLALGSARAEAAIVDLDNLEDAKIETWRRVRRLQAAEAPARPFRVRARAAVADLLDRIDIARWRGAQARAAAAAHAVVVCSEVDRRRIGAGTAVVIPNGYEPREPAATRKPGAILAMVGLMIYPPNYDGARYFARQVLPLVRAEIPDARFRIVGYHDGQLSDLEGLPGIDVVGEVDDVAPTLAAAGAVVVPLRAGSGTRVKVLEAFAERVPVVSTAIGCEGLEVQGGEHLLIADTPLELAEACIRLLREPALAEALVSAGYELWASRYRARDVSELTAELTRRAAA